MVKPIFHGEQVQRITIEQQIMQDPERLFTYVAVTSLAVTVAARSKHYDGYGVGSVFPVYDEEGNSKILTATNYRPSPGQSDGDIRVCSEQALIDNGVHEGDKALGVLFTRGPRPDPNKPIVGCREGMRSLHLCRPCRARMLEFIGPELLIVSFNNDEPEPTEAMSLGQQLGYHDAYTDYPELPTGKSARDVAIEALANAFSLSPVKKPKTPRRRLPAAERHN